MDTPQSSSFDTSSVPFVFNDGFLSFYYPSTGSDSQGASASSVSDAPFLGVFPDSPEELFTHPILRRLAVWRQNDEKDHVYTEINCSTSEFSSLKDLDPSSIRYGAVHASLTQSSAVSCPVIHVFIPLAPFSPSITGDPINSVITISAPSRSPVRLMSTIYKRGTLTFSNESTLTEEACSHFGDAQYSTPLPQQLIEELCKDVDGSSSRDAGMVDSIVVLQFMQHTNTAESRDENIILVLVCDFDTHQGPGPSQARFLNLSPGTIMSQDLSMQIESLPISHPSHDDLPDVKDFGLGSIQNAKRRTSSRVFPKLSVAIPPPCHTKGHIQLYTDSPGPTPTLSPNNHFPLTPQTGVPQNVFPVTPFDQLVLTPSYLPDMQHSRICNHAGHAPMLTEDAYPFTLTAASPSRAQLSVFGRLDSSEHSSQSSTPTFFFFVYGNRL